MKPDYYTKGGLECFDAIKAATEGLTGYEGFLIGNVIKYCWRWNDKGGVADLEKAAEYVRKLIELRAPENRPYTLDELIAMPDGTRVWVEERPGGVFESKWHTKRSNTLTADGGGYYVIEADDLDCAFGGENEERAWPTPPSVDDVARWPWGGGGE